ncbi:MAG: hypothetical protein QM756_18125 [Polyangiaceae bacterium]
MQQVPRAARARQPPPEKWQHEIDEMQAKQGVRLEPAESRDIFRYLAAVSAASRN